MAIALVNKVGVTASGGSTTIASTALSMTTGNFVAVAVNFVLSGTVSSVTDTAGNTYTRAASSNATSGSNQCEFWYAYNITGNASNVVTATFSGSAAGRRIHVIQYSGIQTGSDPLDQANSNVGTSVTSISASVTTTAANELIVAFIAAGGNNVSASSPLTAQVNTNTSTEVTADEIEASTGTYTPTFTRAAAVNMRISVATFIGAAAAGSFLPKIIFMRV